MKKRVEKKREEKKSGEGVVVVVGPLAVAAEAEESRRKGRRSRRGVGRLETCPSAWFALSLSHTLARRRLRADRCRRIVLTTEERKKLGRERGTCCVVEEKGDGIKPKCTASDLADRWSTVDSTTTVRRRRRRPVGGCG